MALERRRFLILDCSSGTRYADLFIDSLSRWIHPHAWDIVHLVEGDKIPVKEMINCYEGVILTGSHCSVNERQVWYDDLILFIQNSSTNGHPKIFGGCFGTQIIAHALGGQVDRNPSKTFLLQPELVQLNSNFLHHFPPLSHQNGSPKLIYSLIESHGDCVSVLPSDAILLGSSVSCQHELYLIGSQKNILGCQSHPEFNSRFALEDGQDLLTDSESRAKAIELLTNYSSEESEEFIRNVICPFFFLTK
jgi:GMP synthase-like glutamine amidotransferase